MLIHVLTVSKVEFTKIFSSNSMQKAKKYLFSSTNDELIFFGF